MTSDRPYQRGRSVEDAIAEVRRCAGTQFDPAVAQVLIDVVTEQLGAPSDIRHLRRAS